MRLLFRCCLLSLLCTCGRAPAPPPTELSGTLRYRAADRSLEVTLRLSPADTLPSAPVPTLFGSSLSPLPLAGTGVYRTRRQLELPPLIQLTAPCSTGDCPVALPFVAPRIDSLPAELSNSRSTAFPVADAGLTPAESIVVFFEPADRSSPRRLQLVGPSTSGVLTLPARALADVPPGKYEVYLIKQQLVRDSTEHLRYSLQTEYFTRSKNVTVTD
ncbi:MAG: hypothetical protein AAFN92_00530 [Bacteroidota bacterium]